MSPTSEFMAEVSLAHSYPELFRVTGFKGFARRSGIQVFRLYSRLSPEQANFVTLCLECVLERKIMVFKVPWPPPGVCLLLQDLLQSCSRGWEEESGGHVL